MGMWFFFYLVALVCYPTYQTLSRLLFFLFKLLLFILLASLRKLDEQPDWLKGGKLRDYQLEGLNFLVNRYVIQIPPLGLGNCYI